MNGNLAMIFGFTIAALWILSTRHPHLFSRHADRDGRGEDGDVNAELLDQIDRLEERVRVLERIVTDDPKDLRREFRELGD